MQSLVLGKNAFWGSQVKKKKKKHDHIRHVPKVSEILKYHSCIAHHYFLSLIKIVFIENRNNLTFIQFILYFPVLTGRSLISRRYMYFPGFPAQYFPHSWYFPDNPDVCEWLSSSSEQFQTQILNMGTILMLELLSIYFKRVCVY